MPQSVVFRDCRGRLRDGLAAGPHNVSSCAQIGTRAAQSSANSGKDPGTGVQRCAPTFRNVSTLWVPAHRRFDYWQSHFMTLRMDRPFAAAGDFHGEMLHTTPWQDTIFVHLRHDPLICRFGGRDPDSIVLFHVRSGVVNIRHGRDSIVSVGAHAGLMVFDRNRPLVTVQPQPCAMTCLILPRTLVADALGAQPVMRGDAVRQFPHPGPLIGGFLRHLDDMVAAAPHFEGMDVATAVTTARHLAATLLARRNPRRWRLSEVFDDSLLASARHLLDLHAGRPDLTARQVAIMLGCSRAHLYRVFARRDTTVARELREIRLRRARRRLESEPATPIGAVAWECGYSDFSAFGKAFRRHHGMTPGEVRYRRRSTER